CRRPRRAARSPAPGGPHRWRSASGAAWLRSWRLFSVLREFELHELVLQVEDLLEDEEALVRTAPVEAGEEVPHLRLPPGVDLGCRHCGLGCGQFLRLDATHEQAVVTHVQGVPVP